MRPCACSVAEVHRYRSRLSGPLLDRIDLHLTLMPVQRRLLGTNDGAERSEAVRARVEQARDRQRRRYAAAGVRASINAEVSGRLLLSGLSPDARELLDCAAESLALSARAYHRVVKVARTIADLAGSDMVAGEFMAEALRYRPLTATAVVLAPAVSSRRSVAAGQSPLAGRDDAPIT